MNDAQGLHSVPHQILSAQPAKYLKCLTHSGMSPALATASGLPLSCAKAAHVGHQPTSEHLL